MEQLRFYPVSTSRFDGYLVAAYQLFCSALLRNEICIEMIPPVLYTAMHNAITEKERMYRRQLKTDLLEAIYSELHEQATHADFPKKEDVLEAERSNPLPWDYTLKRGQNQPEQSYTEQKQCIQVLKQNVDLYVWHVSACVPNMGIVGGPGCGKTFIALSCLLYSMSGGLMVMSTALLANRARSLGGRHLHELFCLTSNMDHLPAQRVAELALNRLLRSPEKVALLRALDQLLVDEFLQNSAKMLSVVDIIFRRTRQSNAPYGGVMLVTTMDEYQIKAVNALPAILSPLVVSTFRFLKLKESVRAANDPVFRRIQEITRMPASTVIANPSLKQEFEALVRQHCTFVDNWDDPRISDTCFRMLGKHVAAEEALSRFLSNKRRKLSPNEYVRCFSEDSQVSSQSHMEWEPACPEVTKLMNKKSKEPQELMFMKGALYQFTYNQGLTFAQSQLGCILKLPDRSSVGSFCPIDIYVSPPGNEAYPPQLTEECFRFNKWKKVKVGVAPERIHYVMHQKAKRRQYGLQHFVAGTIHAGMGRTLYQVATEIGQANENFHLWDRGQLVVLMSRTKYARDTIFVTEEVDDTVKALSTLLKRQSQFDAFIEHLIKMLSVGEEIEYPHLNYNDFPYRLKDIAIPQDCSGFVYCLLSTKDMMTTYIGETYNLTARLRLHNTGYGAEQTRHENLRPWALVGFVCGFNGNKDDMRLFESHWRFRQRQWATQPGLNRDVKDLLLSAQDIIKAHFQDRFEVNAEILRLVLLIETASREE